MRAPTISILDLRSTLQTSRNISLLQYLFQVRTWHEEGLLVFHKFSSSGHLKLLLSAGMLRCEVHTDNELAVMLEQYDVMINDGDYHMLSLSMVQGNVSLSVDNLVISTPAQSHFRTGQCGVERKLFFI